MDLVLQMKKTGYVIAAVTLAYLWILAFYSIISYLVA
jgi:hypothetical protein